jgi:release factor glutamine methyltransferase
VKSIGEIINASTLFLKSKEVGAPRRLSEELLGALLQMKRIDLYLQYDRPVEEEILAALRGWMKRLGVGEPVEYIVGEVEFFGCKLKIDKRVLIPRPETEILVDQIAKRLGGAREVWDLCTGSGCIGIALKKKFPEISVSLSDQSEEALFLARENGERNGVAVELLLGDLLEPFAGRKADLIAVNPPYVSTSEYLALDAGVREFEPKAALLAGERGTEVYERLAGELPKFLNPLGRVFLEIGSAQGAAVKEIFSSPIWAKRELLQDWSGKDRFFFLEKGNFP